jgi:hypothetical protein
MHACPVTHHSAVRHVGASCAWADFGQWQRRILRHSGRAHDLRTKMDVGQACVSLFQENHPARPSIRAVAKKAKFCMNCASKVIGELVLTGTLIGETGTFR